MMSLCLQHFLQCCKQWLMPCFHVWVWQGVATCKLLVSHVQGALSNVSLRLLSGKADSLLMPSSLRAVSTEFQGDLNSSEEREINKNHAKNWFKVLLVTITDTRKKTVFEKKIHECAVLLYIQGFWVILNKFLASITALSTSRSSIITKMKRRNFRSVYWHLVMRLGPSKCC